ncbi:MAG: hypothetical protein ACO1TE_07880 [Prosthecobacter sp.]
MFPWRPPVVAAAILLALLAGGYIAIDIFVTWQLEKPVIHTVNDPRDPITIWRSMKPLSHAEAVETGKCPIPLPREAARIQYVDFTVGYGGFSRCVRFEAPVDICREHAAAVLKAYNQRMETAHNDSHLAVHASPLNKGTAESVATLMRDQGEEVARASWFDTDAIVHGEMWGKHGGHTPLVLIDTDKQVFYYVIFD